MIALLLVAAVLGQAGAPEAPPGSAPAGQGQGQGQEQDQGWVGLPGEAPGSTAPSPRSEPGSYGHLPIPPTIEYPLPGAPVRPPPEPPNLTSLHSALPLGPGRRGVALGLGFPLLGGRVMQGLSPRFDLGVSYESFYGMMHDVRAVARFHLFTAGAVALGVWGDAGVAFFALAPANEVTGPRWLTGRRNVNSTLGLVFSAQGSEGRSTRFFISARALLAADTEPFQRDPLGGVPPPVTFAASALSEVGLEVPVGEWIALVFRLGLDFHGHSDDSAVMVNFAAGVVTALP